MTKFASKLISVKSQLVQIIDDHPYPQYDGEQLEYLVQLIDYMLLGKTELNEQTIVTLMEEIITTSVHQLNLDLLDLLHPLAEIQKELYGIEI